MTNQILQPMLPKPLIISNDGLIFSGTLTNTLLANTVYLMAFSLSAFTSIASVRWRMGATATGATNIAIYNAVTGAIVPGSDTGAVTNIAATAQTFTYATPVGLPAGQYYLALACNNATDTYQGLSQAVALSELTSYRKAANALAAGAMPLTTGAISFSASQPSMIALVSGGLV